MGDCVKLDDKGFMLTGQATKDGDDFPSATSVSGIVAVGDMRSGSVERVASGVGKGLVCISRVQGYLAVRDEEEG